MARSTMAALLWVTALAGAAPAGWAQPLVENSAPPDISFESWHLLKFEAHTGYMSLALPNANFNYLLGTVPLGSDIMSGGSVSIGFQRHKRFSNVEFTYQPTYYSLARHSEWSALNHSLNLHAGKKLAERWNANFSLAGSSSNLNGFMFTPPVLAHVAGAPGTFTALTDAVLAGRYNNDQIASIMTGAPLLESPARTMIYGTRVLNGSFSGSLSYTPTARLAVHLGVTGSHSQGLHDTQDVDIWSRAIVQRNTTGSANASITYLLTPRSDFGLDATGGRSISPLVDAYNTTIMASMGRRIGTRWFLKGAGGVAVVTPLRQQAYRSYRIPDGPQPVGHGSFGYRTWRQTFMATVDRNADLYGTAAGYTLAVGGAWTWHHPASAWQYTASLRQQRMRGGVVQELDGWLGTVGIQRALNRHSAMQLSYTYLQNSGTYLGAARDISVQAIQFSVLWQEQPTR